MSQREESPFNGSVHSPECWTPPRPPPPEYGENRHVEPAPTLATYMLRALVDCPRGRAGTVFFSPIEETRDLLDRGLVEQQPDVAGPYVDVSSGALVFLSSAAAENGLRTREVRPLGAAEVAQLRALLFPPVAPPESPAEVADLLPVAKTSRGRRTR